MLAPLVRQTAISAHREILRQQQAYRHVHDTRRTLLTDIIGRFSTELQEVDTLARLYGLQA
jgi:hypothetical protein